jgi:nitrogen fixation NifU-like protein
MNSELRDLYQQVILDHNRAPRNFHEMAGATHTASGDNPLCGDNIRLFARVEDGTVAEVAFVGSGCAISTASASLMTSIVKGKSLAEAEDLFAAFHGMVTGRTEPDKQVLGKLMAFAGVREFPARVKCANLPWHTLHAALAGAGAASTE